MEGKGKRGREGERREGMKRGRARETEVEGNREK
jgi:hypothetical protein